MLVSRHNGAVRNRQSKIISQPQAVTSPPWHVPRSFVLRMLTPEFCPADFVAWLGFEKEGDLRADITRAHSKT
jgi:hypothetical protein